MSIVTLTPAPGVVFRATCASLPLPRAEAAYFAAAGCFAPADAVRLRRALEVSYHELFYARCVGSA